MLLRFILIIFISCTNSALGWSNGARINTCDTMRPNHQGHEPQEGPAPYEVILPETIYAGSQIPVIIRDNSGQGFRGFKILARDGSSNFVGMFSESETVQTLTCGEVVGSAATQRDASVLDAVNLLWLAPRTDDDLDINFLVTIVQSRFIFWVNHTVSATILPDISLPPVNTPPEDTTPDTTTPDNESNGIYRDCGVTKTCFGYPPYCIQSRNCQMFGAVIHDDGNFTFELLSMNNDNYVAFGLSHSRSMEDSSVIECVRDQTTVRAFTSWTVRREYAVRAYVDPNIISLDVGSLVDSRIYCRVSRQAQTVIQGQTFDLLSSSFYLVMASGTEMQPEINSVGMHNLDAYSRYQMNLTIPQVVEAVVVDRSLMYTHGALMFIAWIGLTSIGIVIARYFKKGWPNAKVGGKDMWFIWHVICMALTWLFTIIGFILIFVHLGEWRTSTHAVLGCIVLFFAVLQPIGAIFRPGPDDDSRPLFNWLHKSFGNITHGLAVITIFYAVRFPRAGLPHYTLYILTAFVTFYLLIHIIFTSINICGEMKKDKKSNEASKIMPYQILQKTLLGFYITVVLAFVIMLNVVFMLDFD